MVFGFVCLRNKIRIGKILARKLKGDNEFEVRRNKSNIDMSLREWILDTKNRQVYFLYFWSRHENKFVINKSKVQNVSIPLQLHVDPDIRKNSRILID